MAYDTQESNGSSASAVGGAASQVGTATSGGGRSGNGGSGGSGSISGSTGGAETTSVNCVTVEPQTLLDRAPVCTFPPKDHRDARDCQSSPVSVYVEQGLTYLVASSVTQCAERRTEPVELYHAGKAYRNSVEEIVTGQVLSSGLVRLNCKAGDGEGYYWEYNVTCSASGLQTIQPHLKAGNLYVEFPDGEGVPGGYEGLLVSYYRAEPGAEMVYMSKSGDDTPLGTEPVAYSIDGKTFWFNDMSGRRVTIVVDDEYRVIDIQR